MKTSQFLTLLFAIAIGIGIGYFLLHPVSIDAAQRKIDSLHSAVVLKEKERYALEFRTHKKDEQIKQAEHRASDSELRAIAAENRLKLIESDFRSLPKPGNKNDSVIYFQVGFTKCAEALDVADSTIIAYKNALTDSKRVIILQAQTIAIRDSTIANLKLENKALIQTDSLHQVVEKQLKRKNFKNVIKASILGAAMTLFFEAFIPKP